MTFSLAADLPADLSTHLIVGHERAKVLIRGRRGCGVAATDRGLHFFEPRRGTQGFPWLSMEFCPYSALAGLKYVPASGWFGHPKVVAGPHALELEKSQDGLTPGGFEELRLLLDMRDYELRREYQPGHDPDFTFACPLCGRQASARQAAKTRLRLAEEHLGWNALVWDATQCRDAAYTPELLEEMLGITYRQAEGIFAEAERVGLLARQRNGSYFRAISLCDSCYEARVNPPEPTPVPEPKMRRRDPIPPRLRFIVLQRDGFRCRYCGKAAGDGVVLHVDHVEPVAAGGEMTEDNLITACDECNLGKSDRDLFS